ncbi:hypothetical protein [Streptomyces sp. SID13588]|uniref:hypothetical protein n=1 Tax=Streptomyces sp. SID13588 TaxID=2706051 RepID=UPI0013C80AB7|nr:hypothetical protein [Streptomyces sp. SID13588]NEA72158.1 hypothetical protein [Streptomyces sp. SID13588]
MTAPHSSPARVCPDCDGFPSVAITTGTRTPSGQRTTVTVNCHACNGTGTAPARRRLLVPAGR